MTLRTAGTGSFSVELDEAWIARATSRARARLEQGGVDVQGLRRRGLKRAARNDALLAAHDRRYALMLPFGRVEDQASSGRCWLFAPMVLARLFALRRGVIRSDEAFSEAYLHFFNLLEKANRALVRIGHAVARREPLGPEALRHHLNRDLKGVADGGEWEWAFRLVDKYGVVPAKRMPETASTRHTAELLVELHELVGHAAREMAKGARQPAAIRERALADVTRILVAHLGAPPSRIEVRGRSMTPMELARERLGFRGAEWRVVVSSPRLAAGVVYEQRGSALVVDEERRERFDLRRLNVPMARFRELVRRSIRMGYAVGFSADVERNDIDNRSGIMHPAIFDRARVYGQSPIRDLARRDDIFLGVATSNHAMAIVGFDVEDRDDLDSPLVKLRVVNSWGDSSGDRGLYHLYMPWFEENVFKIAVHESVLAPRERDAWARPVRKLPGKTFY